MPQRANIAQSRALENLASDVYNLAFEVAEPSRSIVRSDRMTAEGERIAAALRATAVEASALFRGR